MGEECRMEADVHLLDRFPRWALPSLRWGGGLIATAQDSTVKGDQTERQRLICQTDRA